MKIKTIINKCREREILHVSLKEYEDIEIDGLNFCDRKTEKKSILAFAVNTKYINAVKENIFIKALIVSKEAESSYRQMLKERGGCLIVSEQPEIDFYRIHEFLCSETAFYEKYNFPPKIGKNCKIDSTAVIENGVILGDKVTIGPSTVVRSGSVIDSNTVIGCNTVIGSEGFQLIKCEQSSPMHVTHVGKCHISSNVYIGDNTCICNSLFEGETYIGAGTKIDNLVYIAHNLFVGKNVVITAQVALCGSCVVEDGVWIAPNVSVLNKVTLGKGSKVGLGSVVTKDVEPGSVVYGNPAKKHR